MVIIGKRAKYAVFAVCVVFIVFLCASPAEMLDSVKDGLLLWYNSVLPSIFPFIVVSSILIEIGAVNKIGRALEPVMRPVFNVPGCGAFALAMGGISGYPVGASVVAGFREKGLITKDEAQRLISFTNNAGPLFVVGAVGSAILGSVAAGYYILITNYAAAILVGIIFRFYKTGEHAQSSNREVFVRARKTQPFGTVVSVSVARSIETVLQIAGFIVLFSVLIKIFEISGVLEMLSATATPLFVFAGIEGSLAVPVFSGFFEITNGIKAAAQTEALFFHKVVVAGVLVSFGGLSIFAQAVSFISKTDISPKIYFLSKLLQASLHLAIMLLTHKLLPPL